MSSVLDPQAETMGGGESHGALNIVNVSGLDDVRR